MFCGEQLFVWIGKFSSIVIPQYNTLRKMQEALPDICRL